MNKEMSLSHFSSFWSSWPKKFADRTNKITLLGSKTRETPNHASRQGEGEKALKTLPIIRKENKRAKTAFPVLAAFSTSSTSKTSHNEHFSIFSDSMNIEWKQKHVLFIIYVRNYTLTR